MLKSWAVAIGLWPFSGILFKKLAIGPLAHTKNRKYTADTTAMREPGGDMRGCEGAQWVGGPEAPTLQEGST